MSTDVDSQCTRLLHVDLGRCAVGHFALLDLTSAAIDSAPAWRDEQSGVVDAAGPTGGRDLLTPTESACDVARLEWDRGHEHLDVLVRLETAQALIVTVIHDLWPQSGCQWIAADEVLDLERCEANDPVVRVAEHTGARKLRAGAELAQLPNVFARLREASLLAGIYARRTGSGSVLVGKVSGVDAQEVTLDDVDTDGALSGDQLTYRYGEIASVEWGTDYLTALAMLSEE